MGSQQGRLPRQELQLVYETAIELLRRWDPDRLQGRDPRLQRCLDRVKTHFGLKDPMNRANHGSVPTRALQKIYDIARFAAHDNEKYRQLRDPETGEPLGEHKNLEEAFERVRIYFGLIEPKIR